jgi:hypothetical protein
MFEEQNNTYLCFIDENSCGNDFYNFNYILILIKIFFIMLIVKIFSFFTNYKNKNNTNYKKRKYYTEKYFKNKRRKII